MNKVGGGGDEEMWFGCVVGGGWGGGGGGGSGVTVYGFHGLPLNTYFYLHVFIPDIKLS